MYILNVRCNFQRIFKDIQLKLNKIECDKGEIKERFHNLELKTGEKRKSQASPNQPHKGVSGPGTLR